MLPALRCIPFFVSAAGGGDRRRAGAARRGVRRFRRRQLRAGRRQQRARAGAAGAALRRARRRRDDAVLRDVGGYPAANVVTALHPDRAGCSPPSPRCASGCSSMPRAASRPQLLFYYSGHARADAITLGREELPLAELRQRPAAAGTLTVVVLDACQSGAFSRIKGAEPTADFSFNSVARLDTAGVAVMASSSASELWQESDAADVVVLHAPPARRAARRRRRQPRRPGQPRRGLPLRL